MILNEVTFHPVNDGSLHIQTRWLRSVLQETVRMPDVWRVSLRLRRLHSPFLLVNSLKVCFYCFPFVYLFKQNQDFIWNSRSKRAGKHEAAPERHLKIIFQEGIGQKKERINQVSSVLPQWNHTGERKRNLRGPQGEVNTWKWLSRSGRPLKHPQVKWHNKHNVGICRRLLLHLGDMKHEAS